MRLYSSTLLFFGQYIIASASVLPGIDVRAQPASHCGDLPIILIDDILKLFPNPAKKICSTLLKRTLILTLTVTKTTSVTKPTTTDKSTVVTVSAGTVTVTTLTETTVVETSTVETE